MDRITVYYDGACPQCVRDRRSYECIAGKTADNVIWFDITGKDSELRELGIDPLLALTELHIKDENNHIRSELDAYIFLMKRTRALRFLAWIIDLPLIRPVLSRLYHWFVVRRLRREGRL